MRKGPKKNDRRRPRELHRVNHRIRVPEVRVVLDDGTQLGILSRDEALRVAEEKGLDLVEIAARSNPPVCRVMDYGKFKYEQAKKQRAAKKGQSSLELKEIKFRPKTDQHDLDFKIKHIRRFLEEGNKVRLVIVFRGREVVHPKTGVAVLDKVVDATTDIATVEVRPSLEGKRMFMILGPRAGVVRRAPARHVETDEEALNRPRSAPQPRPERPAAESKGNGEAKAEQPAERPASQAPAET